MLGLYNTGKGAQYIQCRDALITVRENVELRQVSLHTPHYISPFGDELVFKHYTYGVTLWTVQCYEDYLERTIAGLMARYYNDTERDKALRAAGGANIYGTYSEVHSHMEDCPAEFTRGFGKKSTADDICEAWASKVLKDRATVRADLEVWESFQHTGCECTYIRFMEELEALRNWSNGTPAAELVEKLRSRIKKFGGK